ncbi:Hypothetical predicted protein [Mytilus galloprovincialis]|uniref:AIG1-type G domain-containing protein n=1 Tax=Mytilus galloprovincialis TaxID=29158 RepID=A0A8B6GWL2_MYTGA|nr:Hypothetical predicted protein [Mytilus galloprovincialis]
MDCTKCSYRVKCCPTCGASLETEKDIPEKNISSTDEKIVESTEMKSHVECASFSDNTPKENKISAKLNRTTDDVCVKGQEKQSHGECWTFNDNPKKENMIADKSNLTTDDVCVEWPENQPLTIPQKDLTEIRMVVFGLPSSGVSSTANTIVGEKLFLDGVSLDVTTKKCQMERCLRFGYVLKVVDTPGFVYDKKMKTAKELFPGLANSLSLLHPGPHIVLVTLSLDRINEDLDHMIQCLKCLENLSRHVIVVLTKIDQIEKDRTGWKQEIFQSENLSELLEFCGKRVVLFDNTSKSENQVRELLDVVIKLVEGNMPECFTTDYFSHKTNKSLEVFLQDYEKSKKSATERFFGNFGFGK